MIYIKFKSIIGLRDFIWGRNRDLILNDKKPTRSFESDTKDEAKETSALGTIGLKPKPVV